MQWMELLHEINTLHRTTFALGERYSVGEQGAFAVVDQQGRRGVLKWMAGSRAVERLERARAITDRLRAREYPAPCYLYIGLARGGAYSIQAALAGTPLVVSATAEYLPRLLALNRLQVGQAPSGLPDWHQEAVHTVLFGGDGYCLHTSLQHHSSDTATLLSELQRLVAAHQGAPHQQHDIVHGDFQHTNILAQEHRITGIVDWDAVYAGDCVFDLATLLFYSYEDHNVREQLWQYAVQQASLRLLSVYLAHMILRQVDWSLRYHDPSTIERYCKRGTAILAEIQERLNHSRS